MPVRVGFVGCGGMAGGHMSNWAQMKEKGEDVELAAFSDTRKRAFYVLTFLGGLPKVLFELRIGRSSSRRGDLMRKGLATAADCSVGAR